MHIGVEMHQDMEISHQSIKDSVQDSTGFQTNRKKPHTLEAY